MLHQHKLTRLIGIPILAVLIVCVLFIMYYQPGGESLVFKSSNSSKTTMKPMEMSTQEIILKLAAIKSGLHRVQAKDKQQIENAVNDLSSLMIQLDPNYQEDIQQNTQQDIQQNKPEVCPEEYIKSSDEFLKGWKTEDCNYSKPIETLLTILISPTPSSSNNCSKITSWILKGIKDFYPKVKILLANHHPECQQDNIENNNNNIEVIEFNANASYGTVWNNLLARVTTKYSLIGRDLYHFNNFSRLERQISVFSISDKVRVVGGSTRNFSGHWKMGCFQVNLANYILEYKEGYRFSRNECAICSYISSPFVIQTEFAKKINFSESLPGAVLFEDFFLQIRATDELVLTCPDVMYFSTAPLHGNIPEKQVWLPLSKTWQLNYLLFAPHVKHSFTCSESNISCDEVMSVEFTKSHLLPPCCIQQYASAWEFLQELAEKHNWWFQVDSGSALGGAKMAGVLPWDIDGDLIFATTNRTSIEKTVGLFKEKGFKLNIGVRYHLSQPGLTGEYMSIDTPDATIEMWGAKDLPISGLPEELAHIRTKVNINGAWVYAPLSPGLYSRNRYGVEYLRHAQSWRHTGKKSSWVAYVPGLFQSCSGKHHSCLDQYRTDGNLQFALP